MEEAGELNDHLQVNVLDVLRGLVGDSHQSSGIQEADAKENTSIEALKEEVARLQKRKEELSLKLGSQQFKTVKELVLANLEEKVIKHKTKALPEEAYARISVVAKKRKLELIKIGQAICGFTLFEHENKELALRLETCFEGKYYEHYHIFLDLDKNEKLRITHHTIPYFIPLDRVQKKYLNTNIKTFIQVVSDYLNCFVSRREQLVQLTTCENVFFNRLLTSNASDFTTIEVTHKDRKYHMQLSYEDLLATFPSRAEIVTLDDDRKKLRVYEMVPIFLQNHLKAAFEKVFPKNAPTDTPTT